MLKLTVTLKAPLKVYCNLNTRTYECIAGYICKKEHYLYRYLVSAGRPPFGQMPFIETPEGKHIAMSGTITKYICKKGGNI